MSFSWSPWAAGSVFWPFMPAMPWRRFLGGLKRKPVEGDYSRCLGGRKWGLPIIVADAGEEKARRRLKGFGIHLAGYFGVMVLAVPLNLYFLPENPLFLLPMIGWGALLGLHAALVMGLFQGLFGPSKTGR